MANRYKDPGTGQFLTKRAAKKAAAEAPPLADGIAGISREEYERLVEEQQRCDPRLPYALTPLGHAQAQAELRASGKPIADPRIQVTRDSHDKIYEARNDAIDGKLNEWEAPDPLRDLKERYGRPGHELRLMSDRAVQRLGMERWTPVRGEAGDVVRYGQESFLAEVPTELAKARDRMYREKTADEIASINERAQAMMDSARAEGLEPLDIGGRFRTNSKPSVGVRITGADTVEQSGRVAAE